MAIRLKPRPRVSIARATDARPVELAQQLGLGVEFVGGLKGNPNGGYSQCEQQSRKSLQAVGC